jgi:hypothetical protein
MHALSLVTFLTTVTDPVPQDNDVKAGWLAFAIFIGLILAVAFLGFSLVKQLRKAEAAEKSGLYDPSDRTLRERAEREQAERESAEAAQTGSGDQPADQA